ncbi:MAG TPA: PEPxxWA-CTERM sorting domain-containing protein [Phenylobacterium sp.]|jgi:hypothetical protein|nr:PEPxxWA-CTERM sorting domain-containing protein [Phenylobacterium sp.]
MNIRTALFAAAALASSLVAGTAAQAAAITSLFDTGVNASGTPLADGTIGDPHYSLVGVPGGTSDIRVRTAIGGFPIGPYFGDDATSAWIGPNNDSQIDGGLGLFDYQTTFTLAGFNAATASISGGWSSDNNGVEILLNGVDTGNAGTDFAQFQIGFAPFSITSGFHAGVNTLDFIVNNGGGPTALRVEMSGSAATAGGVPEPAAWTMMIAGFGGIGAMLRSRRRTAAATA